MASKNISTLGVVLTSTVAPFVNGFNNASKAATSLASSLGSTALKFTGIGAALGALGGIAGITVLVNQQLEAVDVTAKLSDRLGITTETIEGMTHAANLAGVSQEQLTGGLEFMLKNVGKAAAGNKQLGATFAGLGLDVKSLHSSNPDAAFGMIADSLASIENPADRALAATQIFGKSGQQLLPLLMSGSNGISAMNAEAAALGLTFSRLDAAKVEEANDAISRMKSAGGGVFRQIAIAVAPFLTQMADAGTAIGIKLVAGVKEHLPTFIAGIRMAASVVMQIWTGVTTALAPIVSYVGGILATVVNVVSTNFQTILSTVIQYAMSLYNVTASILKAVWNIVSAVLSPVVNLFVWAWGAIVGTTAEAGGSIGGSLTTIGGWFKWMYETVSMVLNTISYTLDNFRLFTDYVFTSAAHSVVQFANQIAHFFTAVIPAHLNWLADNWRNIFTTLWSFTSSVFANMGKNVGGFFVALYSALKGDGFNFKWTGLLDGFESTLTELPKIAERQVGPLEAALGGDAAALGKQYSEGLGAFLNQQDASADGAAAAVANAFSGITMPTATVDVATNIGGAADATADVADAANDVAAATNSATTAAKAAEKQAAGIGLLFANSAESQRSLYQASMGESFTTPTVANAAATAIDANGEVMPTTSMPVSAQAQLQGQQGGALARLAEELPKLMKEANGYLRTMATSNGGYETAAL